MRTSANSPSTKAASWMCACLISVAIAMTGTTAAEIKHAHIHEAAFVEGEFAFFVLSVPGEDAQRFISPRGGIPTHGLVVHCDSAVYPTASYQILEDIGDVVALIPGAIIGAQDLPAFFLGT